MKFSISRWHYIWAYLLILILALLATWFNDHGHDFFSWSSAFLAVGFLLLFETLIRKETLTVNSKTIIYTRGIFNSKSYLVESEIKIHQNWFQKLLRYGTAVFTANNEKVVLKGLSYAGLFKKSLKN